MEMVKVKLEFTVSKRWLKKIIALLSCLKYCGDVGTSRTIGFYADGDGDFRIKDIKMNGVEIDPKIDWEKYGNEPVFYDENAGILNKYKTTRQVDFFFDAG